jgi:hypothetical protein
VLISRASYGSNRLVKAAAFAGEQTIRDWSVIGGHPAFWPNIVRVRIAIGRDLPPLIVLIAAKCGRSLPGNRTASMVRPEDARRVHSGTRTTRPDASTTYA